MLAFGMTRDTYSPVEVSMISDGDNHGTLPHLYSCTEQLRLLRNMIVREEGDALRIGDAIPRQWLEPGKRVAATDAPTRFGPVSFAISPQADGTMTLSITPPTRQPPAKIIVRFRHPKHATVADVNATPKVETETAGETVVFKDLREPIEATVRFGFTPGNSGGR
jgi:hypothetical protein